MLEVAYTEIINGSRKNRIILRRSTILKRIKTAVLNDLDSTATEEYKAKLLQAFNEANWASGTIVMMKNGDGSAEEWTIQ